MKILITHISYHCSVGLIKQIRKLNKKITIFGTSHLQLGLSSGSMLVDKFIQVSDSYEDNYLLELENIINSEKIDFIFTGDENEMILFNDHNFQSRYNVIPFSSNENIKLFMDKLNASYAMKELGLSIPLIIESTDEIDNFKSDKIIVRENQSCCSYGISIKEKNKDCLKYKTDKNFIQEFIVGNEYTVDVLCDKNGELKLIVPRLRLAIRNGITYKCKIEYNANLIDLCKKIYKKYNIPGLSNVQFIVNKDNFYFIELNPRIGGTTIASSIASFNFVEMILADFFNKKEISDFDTNMKQVKWNATICRYYEETIYE